MPVLRENAATVADAVLALRPELDEPTKQRIRAAVIRAARDRRRQAHSVSKDDQRDFLALLAGGLAIDDAAEMIDRSTSALYAARKADPSFERAWADALEAGCAPVERRLQSIALDGDAGSMATVRAAEVLLKTRHRAHQQRPTGPVSATVESPAGGSLTIRLGGPFGD